MRIGEQTLTQIRFTIAASPDLCPAEVEPLISSEAVDRGRVLAAERCAIGVVSDSETGKVGDVFAQGQLALDVKPRQRLVGVILCRELASECLKVGDVLGRPPIA